MSGPASHGGRAYSCAARGGTGGVRCTRTGQRGCRGVPGEGTPRTCPRLGLTASSRTGPDSSSPRTTSSTLTSHRRVRVVWLKSLIIAYGIVRYGEVWAGTGHTSPHPVGFGSVWPDLASAPPQLGLSIGLVRPSRRRGRASPVPCLARPGLARTGLGPATPGLYQTYI